MSKKRGGRGDWGTEEVGWGIRKGGGKAGVAKGEERCRKYRRWSGEVGG